VGELNCKTNDLLFCLFRPHSPSQSHPLSTDPVLAPVLRVGELEKQRVGVKNLKPDKLPVRLFLPFSLSHYDPVLALVLRVGEREKR